MVSMQDIGITAEQLGFTIGKVFTFVCLLFIGYLISNWIHRKDRKEDTEDKEEGEVKVNE